jgi:hypothetical protein
VKLDDKNKFIMAINEYFGYEIQNIQQFERELKEDYLDFEQLQEVLNFLYHYERKLSR